MSKLLLNICVLCFLYLPAFPQDVYQRNENANVTRYVFALSLNDSNNEIKGESSITVDFKEGAQNFSLDLIGKSGKYGMEVTGVFEENNQVDYEFTDNKIIIKLKPPVRKTRTFRVTYHGIPERGLVIDTTKFGNRSFFGDNWPNLARHWLPCVDHPYDKASIEFKVTAPEYYDVVATGKLVEESNLGKGFKLTIYKEPAPVAMKVVTIGVTRFAMRQLGTVGEIPVSAWVYPENREAGFSDYAVAVNILDYFVKNIGPFPFAKLANVQAKTQWGGLENAGTISYFENSVTGKNTIEGLMAHEIAHQWFGNSATENSWNHVWLSEGFATYFAILYQESVYGNEKRKEELAIDRKEILEYYRENPTAPVVDNSIKNPFRVLNTNTYQKGGWVLNMLRHYLGDEVFWNGIRSYYKTFRNSNAMTKDFQEVMEQVSGKNLDDFFDQWIFSEGHPELTFNWGYSRGSLKIKINQVQEHRVFKFALEIAIIQNGNRTIESLVIESKVNEFNIPLERKPENILIDPEMWMLFELR